MQKFVEERLSKVKLDKGRATQKKDDASEKEKAQMRAACGSLNWLSKEGRPDLSGPASLLSSKLATAKVEDILALNEVVRGVKRVPELCIRIQPLMNMRFGVVSDASFGNDGMHSQSGQICAMKMVYSRTNECARTLFAGEVVKLREWSTAH